MDLRSALSKEVAVEQAVSPIYEAAKILHEHQDKTVFFERVEGSKLKVVGNLCPSRERICSVLGTNREAYIKHVLKAIDNPIEPKVVDEAPCYEVKEKDLNALPILWHFRGDAGRYMTSSIVIAKDPEYGRNASVHRLLVLDGHRVSARLVERHLFLYQKRAEERGEPLEVAIAIGVHPAVMYSAAYSVPQGYDEFRLASALLRRPLEMARCKTVDLEVPAASEVVLEGRILPGERVAEGPFVDITGTYDIVRQQPVIEITHIAHRKNAIYHAILPSGMEHRMLMGMPREPKIYSQVSKAVDVTNVCLTDGGVNWLHGAISIRKKTEEDPRKAIQLALQAHPSMKHVVIVDEDIDIFDPKSLEFALATRFQADEDIVLIKNAKGSSLDPSAKEDGITAKTGFDATKPLAEKEAFERAPIG